MVLCLVRTCIYVEQEIEYLGLQTKAGQIILQNHMLEKIENFSEKIKDRKQKGFLDALPMLQISLNI